MSGVLFYLQLLLLEFALVGLGISGAVSQTSLAHSNLSADPFDSYWFQLDSTAGIDLNVTNITELRGDLVVGGLFRYGGNVPVFNLAKWNGSIWDSLGNGYPVAVGALATYHDNVVVGGSVGVNVWNGTSWSTIASIVTQNEGVNSLCAYGPGLVAGGTFQSIGGATANGVAVWDGFNWTPLGNGVTVTSSQVRAQVYALAVFNNQLVAGGFFTQAGSVSAMNIATWDGQSWNTLGAGVDGLVRSLCVYNGRLCVGGNFGTAGGISANNIASWNGAAWSPLGAGTSRYVAALREFDGLLFAGGAFTTAGNEDASMISSWDGYDWHRLGSGVNWPVWALGVFSNQLWVGGSFVTAGGKQSYHVAAWTRTSSNCCLTKTGNVDCDPSDQADISDLSVLIDHLYVSLSPLCCPKEANLDGSIDGNVDISDLTALIDYLYISFAQPADCQ